jgi:hypothetical protein
MSKRRPEGNLKPVEKFQIRQFREAGVSLKECASYHHVSVATALRALAELREKLGPEKLPPHRRQLARSHLTTSQPASHNPDST